MPDNTVKIAEVRALLEAGVTSHSTPGTSTQVDLAALRIELAKLMSENTGAGAKKKRLYKPVRMGDFAE